MDEKEREKVALFRFGLIAPILQGQVTNIREYLAEVADRVHQVPHYGPEGVRSQNHRVLGEGLPEGGV